MAAFLKCVLLVFLEQIQLECIELFGMQLQNDIVLEGGKKLLFWEMTLSN